ncbi:hypothetical protein [uncultured Aquimarina sp.]|uniref:hypothetical protein n=1 Tax=uncultured Aquimarina sp. TaxID=575652 RepID=UPI002613FD25|nr:hypothetical protein [uncultured Aquimarina sp.]
MNIKFTFLLAFVFTVSYSQTEFVSLGGIQDNSPTINNELLDAVQSIQNNGTITIKGDIIIRNDFIIPQNVILNFFKGNKLIIENGAKLTVNGGIRAGLYEIFEVENENSIEGEPIIDYIYPQWFGALGYDEIEDTIEMNFAIQMALKTKIPLFISPGTFIANTEAINESIKITGNGTIKFKDTKIYSPDFDFLGIPHNINRDTVSAVIKPPPASLRITGGNLMEAPTIKNIPNKGLDVIAHWYNDFGLDYTFSTWRNNYNWYDWSWNYDSDNGNPYDPQRHPLLGWYRGDDPKVLDWICYWLGENGINGVSISHVPSTSNWTNRSDKSHWIYQLMQNTKNFKALKYILFTEFTESKSKIESQNNDFIDNILSNYDNIYLYNKNGKKYVTLFCWDLESIRGIYDNYNGSTNTIQYLINFSNKLKSKGYDGLCLLARNYNSNHFDSQIDYLEHNGVVLLKSEYSTRYGTDESYNNSYINYSENVQFPTKTNEVLNIMTSAESRDHTSDWKLYNSSPQYFKNLVDKAVNHIHKYDLPKLLTVYNVSEWAEGGASLIPNQEDLFGYLDAIKSINKYPENNISKNSLFKVSKEWYVSKRNGVVLNGGIGNELTVKDFGEDGQLDQFFSYLDKKEDYVFFVNLDFPSNSIDYQVSYYLNVDFNNKRVYVNVINKSGANISDVGISLMIRKIKI